MSGAGGRPRPASARASRARRSTAATGGNAGAISEAIGEYGGKTVLATPIEEILANPPDAPRGKPIARRSARRARIGRVLPLAEPLTVSGLNRGLARKLTEAGAKAQPPGARRARDAAQPLPRRRRRAPARR